MVVNMFNETCSKAEPIPFRKTTRSVVRASPFEGGSRGMSLELLRIPDAKLETHAER
jgi:hypothetical protein